MMDTSIVVHVIIHWSPVNKLGLGSFFEAEVRGKTYEEDTTRRWRT
jgi:hypothetical protein